jgi:hypothetical protein
MYVLLGPFIFSSSNKLFCVRILLIGKHQQYIHLGFFHIFLNLQNVTHVNILCYGTKEVHMTVVGFDS